MKCQKKLEVADFFCWDGSLVQFGEYEWALQGIVNREIIIDNEDQEIPDVFILGRKVEKGDYIVAEVGFISFYNKENFDKKWKILDKPTDIFEDLETIYAKLRELEQNLINLEEKVFEEEIGE